MKSALGYNGRVIRTWWWVQGNVRVIGCDEWDLPGPIQSASDTR
jgi:hypothetical protein